MPARSDQKGFELFLKSLDTDQTRAAEKYLTLREKLEKFFEWRGCENVEDLTDVVLDRTIKKINEGEKIENAEAFCVSVSRFVLLENRRESMRKVEFNENSRQARSEGVETGSHDDELKQKRFDCLDKCLEKLPVDRRSLLISYFDADEKSMISSRKKLAAELGTNLNSLRIRVSRLKTKLEKCTRDCCDEVQIA